MRQRDPAERLALAALHDGDPARWIEWATRAGRVEVLGDGRSLLEQATREWAAAATRHGVDQSVLICRDNETRRALTTLAREQRRDAGELGEEVSYGPVTVAVVLVPRCLVANNGLRVAGERRANCRVAVNVSDAALDAVPAGGLEGVQGTRFLLRRQRTGRLKFRYGRHLCGRHRRRRRAA
jgi:hypothetical protein